MQRVNLILRDRRGAVRFCHTLEIRDGEEEDEVISHCIISLLRHTWIVGVGDSIEIGERG